MVVPFGGAEHDWAALELAAWTCAATGAPLKLLGAAGQTTSAPASAGCSATPGCWSSSTPASPAEPVVADPAARGSSRRPRSAGLLVIGLSERWQREGLGPTRSEIAKAAPAPVLFVRRGVRAGALAPREDVTRLHLVGARPRRRAAPGPPANTLGAVSEWIREGGIGTSPFPPIAEYGFLSDCQTCALVAPELECGVVVLAPL